MAADGGVDFAVRLINNVTRPAKEIQRAMKDVKGAFDAAKKSVEAPMPKRGGMSDWDKMVGKAKRDQAAQFAREQARIVKLNAADQLKAQKAQAVAAKTSANKQIKEAKRIAEFHKGMAQIKGDQQGGIASFATGALGTGVAVLAAAALAAAAAVGYLAFKFGEAAVAAAAFGERSRLAMSFLIGNAPLAAHQFDLMRKEAQGLGLDVYDTQAGFQKLLAAQFEIGKAKELLRMSADLQSIGASAEHTKRAIVAISQIKNTGYLQGDELNQLREAGVSTELVYEALGKRLGKTNAQLVQMQEKRQLAAEPVIESILEAVRKKTGVETAGDAGKKFAETTLTGMAGTFKARVQNFFIDLGDEILPGLTTLVKLATSTMNKLASDPKIAAIGSFLLREFEFFVLWAEANWPMISDLFVSSAQAMGETLRFTIEMFDTSTLKGKAFVGIMGLLAVTLGIVAVAAFLIMAPLYLLIAVIGAVAYAIYAAVMWVVNAFRELTKFSPIEFGAGSGGVKTAADAGPAARAMGVFSSFDAEKATVAAEPTSQGPAAGPTFDFSGMQVGVDADGDALASKIRTQVRRALEEAPT